MDNIDLNTIYNLLNSKNAKDREREESVQEIYDQLEELDKLIGKLRMAQILYDAEYVSTKSMQTKIQNIRNELENVI